jgi:transcriptional regulator with XRE-family HTH domain
MGNFVDIGSRLKDERELLKLNQEDFAALGGVGRKTQFNYESGERAPDGAYLAALAQHGVDVQYILTGLRASTLTALHEASQEAAAMNLPKELQAKLQELLFASKTGGLELLQSMVLTAQQEQAGYAVEVLTAEEQALLDNYRHSPDVGKRAVDAAVAAVATQEKPKRKIKM